MKFKLLTPEKAVVDRVVASVTLPGKEGQMTVLEGHDFLVAELAAGRLYCRYDDDAGKPQREDYRVGSGLAEVTHHSVMVFVSSVENIQ